MADSATPTVPGTPARTPHAAGTQDVPRTPETPDVLDALDAPDARASLAAAQAGLLAALVAGAGVPDGFDADRVRIQAHALVNKRSGSVASALPGLARTLGADFGRLFAAYAAGRPKPEGGSGADARAFAEWLEER